MKRLKNQTRALILLAFSLLAMKACDNKSCSKAYRFNELNSNQLYTINLCVEGKELYGYVHDVKKEYTVKIYLGCVCLKDIVDSPIVSKNMYSDNRLPYFLSRNTVNSMDKYTYIKIESGNGLLIGNPIKGIKSKEYPQFDSLLTKYKSSVDIMEIIVLNYNRVVQIRFTRGKSNSLPLEI